MDIQAFRWDPHILQLIRSTATKYCRAGGLLPPKLKMYKKVGEDIILPHYLKYCVQF